MSKKDNVKEKMSRKKFLIIVCSCYLVFYVVCKLFLLFALDIYTNNDLLEKKYFDSETINLDINKQSDKELMLKYLNIGKNHIEKGDFESIRI